MSKRLQVLLPEPELADIERMAKQEDMTVAEWVRRALREARSARPAKDPEDKIRAIRQAVEHTFPAPPIEQLIEEIERGYQS